MLQAFKSVLAIAMLLLSVSGYAQNDSKTIIKSIPVKKVKSVEQVAENSDWYYFSTKSQVGLWDNAKKKVLVKPHSDLSVHPTESKELFVVYTTDHWGAILPSGAYMVPIKGFGNDKDSTLCNDRFVVRYNDTYNRMYFRDTLESLNYNMFIDDNFVLVNHRDYRNSKQTMLAVRRSDNKNVKAGNGNVYSFNDGYKVSKGYEKPSDFYDAEFNVILLGLIEKEATIDEYHKLIPHNVDSIGALGYQETYFYSKGKIGLFSWYEGVVLKPEYDLALATGWYYTILVKDGKLGLLVNGGGVVAEAEHDIVEIIEPGNCDPYVRVGDKLFLIYMPDCEIFDHLEEVDFNRYDSVATNNITSSCKVINDGTAMLYNHNRKEYANVYVGVEVDAEGFENEMFADRQIYTNKSGIYNFADNTWQANTRYHAIIPFGKKHYRVVAPQSDPQKGHFSITDLNFKPIDKHTYEDSWVFGGWLVVRDEWGTYFAYSSSDLKRWEIGTCKGDAVEMKGNYMLVGHHDYGSWSYNFEMTIDGIITKELRLIKTGGSTLKFVDDDFAISDTMDDYGDVSYVILDLKSGNALEETYSYIECKDGKSLVLTDQKGQKETISTSDLRAKQ